MGEIWDEGCPKRYPCRQRILADAPIFCAPAHRQPAVAARLDQIVNDDSGWHFVNSDPEQRYEDPPAAKRLKELKMPVLAMVGEEDVPDFRRITRSHLRAGAASKESGHQRSRAHVQYGSSEQVNKALLEFLG